MICLLLMEKVYVESVVVTFISFHEENIGFCCCYLGV